MSKYDEQYIFDLRNWDTNKTYSRESTNEYYDALRKGVIKYFRRRQHYYDIYLNACKTAGIKPKFILQYPITIDSNIDDDDIHTSRRADKIIKFIHEKQTITDIIEETSKLSR